MITSSLLALPLDLRTDALEEIDEGTGTAVHDRNLRGVHLDHRIVHAHAAEGGHQVLHGGDGHPVETEGRRESRVPDIVHIRLDPVVPLQIPADKDDPFIDTGRFDNHADLPSGM